MADEPIQPDGNGVADRMPAAEIEDLLFRLIRTPSHEQAAGGETAVARLLADYLAGEGIDAELRQVLDGRCNLVARLSGRGGGKALLLNGHSDTVPGYGMTTPFQPRVEGERIIGRGSCDMKGALAAMAASLAAIRRGGIRLAGDLLFVVTVGEEGYSPGAAALAAGELAADYAIVGEPTGLQIGIAHKGTARLEARFVGRAAHSSTPQAGINAIHLAAQWIEEVRRRHIPALAEAARSHPLLGNPTVNVGQIHGGTRPAVVPGECSVLIDRRLLPGETEQTAVAELQEIIDELARLDPRMIGQVSVMPVHHGVYHGPFESEPHNLLTAALQASVERRSGARPRLVGLSYWTEAALLARMKGIGAVAVCGPGNIEQAHGDREYLDRRQLLAAQRVYTDVALALCGVA